MWPLALPVNMLKMDNAIHAMPHAQNVMEAILTNAHNVLKDSCYP